MVETRNWYNNIQVLGIIQVYQVFMIFINNYQVTQKVICFVTCFLFYLFNIDATTALRLELVLNSSFNTKNTLYDVLNYCNTIGGQRRLRSSILQPSSDIQLISHRLDAIEEVMNYQDKILLKVYYKI